jgi:hypothetical protein
MIQEFVDKFMAKKEELEKVFSEKHPEEYKEIIAAVVGVIGDEYGTPDKNRIHVIDDGDYQGTLLFVIGANGYQPNGYWYVKVGYGSCSGCDTLQSISDYSDEPPTAEQIKDYMTLALHVVQGLKKMGDEAV